MKVNAYNILKKWLVWYSICPFLLVTSCYPEFKNPLSPPEKTESDREIIGNWSRLSETGGKEFVCVFPRKSGWIDIIYIYEIESDVSIDGPNVLVYEGFTSIVRDNKLLCLRFRKKDFPGIEGKPKVFPYLFVAYQIEHDGKLIARMFSSEKIKRLIQEKKLAGKIIISNSEGLHPFEEMIIDCPSNELVRAISDEGLQAFLSDKIEDKLIFTRNK
jgi:hypothetical protein